MKTESHPVMTLSSFKLLSSNKSKKYSTSLFMFYTELVR